MVYDVFGPCTMCYFPAEFTDDFVNKNFSLNENQNKQQKNRGKWSQQVENNLEIILVYILLIVI